MSRSPLSGRPYNTIRTGSASTSQNPPSVSDSSDRSDESCRSTCHRDNVSVEVVQLDAASRPYLALEPVFKKTPSSAELLGENEQVFPATGRSAAKCSAVWHFAPVETVFPRTPGLTFSLEIGARTTILKVSLPADAFDNRSISGDL